MRSVHLGIVSEKDKIIVFPGMITIPNCFLQ